jgi:succinate-semialdehyde dehydrogenase/glutarate-semialdehyde dehydrogenase
MAASTEAASPAQLVSLSPATLEPVGAVPRTDPARVGDLVAEAALAQEEWWRLGPRGRSRVLAETVQVLLRSSDEIVETVRAETGRPVVEALTIEIFVALSWADWLSKNAARVLRPERLRMPQLHLKHKRAWLSYEPVGVVGVISPWNYPFSIPFVSTATALAAGNGVVLKPSELTPLTGAWVARVLEEAGAPRGLVSVAQGEAEVGAAVVGSPGVAKVLFTGSTEVGRRIAVAAAERLCPVTLELGGRDPMLVFADADVDRAVSAALFGSFANCGQTCVGIERIYVQRELHDEFLARLVAGARGLRLGEDVGPLISEGQLDRVARIVDEASAKVVSGGRRADRDGLFYEPTVLAGRVADDEIFGPVVAVEPFAGEDDAVRLANGSAYGLGASVWSRDLGRAERVASRLDAGMVWTNDFGWSWGAAQAPWGGVKASGYGRVGSKHGLYELSRVRFVDRDRGRIGVPWWMPYDDELADGFRGAFGLLYGRGLARPRAAWRHRRGLVRLAKRYANRP